MAGRKSTGPEVIKRRLEISDLLTKGLSRQDILKYGRKWNLCEKQIDNYISEVKKEWQDLARQDLKENYSEGIAIRKYLYKKADKQDDVKTALQVQDSLAKISGLIIDRTKNENVNIEIELNKDVQTENLELLNDDELSALSFIQAKISGLPMEWSSIGKVSFEPMQYDSGKYLCYVTKHGKLIEPEAIRNEDNTLNTVQLEKAKQKSRLFDTELIDDV